MAKIVSIHSFRGGTGKSNTIANVATLLAADGRNVGVIDTDIQSPGIHAVLGVDQERIDRFLNDYLWGRCAIDEAAVEVGRASNPGRLWLVPSSLEPAEIARVMQEGYDVALLNEGCRDLIARLALDVLLLDTHPGINEETLLSIAISDALAIVMRPDRQDYEGTRVTVAVARRLKVPRMLLVVNNTPAAFDADEVKHRVESTYECEVAAVLPHSEELMVLSSGGVFALRYPQHSLTGLYRDIAGRLMA